MKLFFIATARNDNKGRFIGRGFSETDFRCLQLFPLLATRVRGLVGFDIVFVVQRFYFFADIEVVLTLNHFDISYFRFQLTVGALISSKLNLAGLAVGWWRHHHVHVLLTTIKTLLK